MRFSTFIFIVLDKKSMSTDIYNISFGLPRQGNPLSIILASFI